MPLATDVAAPERNEHEHRHRDRDDAEPAHAGPRRGRARRGVPEGDRGPAPRRRGDRRDHLLHQHLQPERHAGGRAAGEEGGREGPARPAGGQDLAGARLARGHRVSEEDRPAAVPGRARLPDGRLRLHHLHRQLRPAGAAPGRDDHQERPGGRQRPVRQPQLRGARPPEREGQLPDEPAAGGRLRAGGRVDIDMANEPLGKGQRRAGRLPAGHLAEPRRRSARRCRPRPTRRPTAGSTSDFARPEPALGRRSRAASGKVYEWDPHSTYIQEPPYFDKFGMEPEHGEDIRSARPLAIFGDSVTTDHISPAGAIKPTSPAGLYLQEQGRRRRRTSTPTARAAATTG